MRLISEFKSGLAAGGAEGDPGASGEGDPTDPADGSAVNASIALRGTLSEFMR